MSNLLVVLLLVKIAAYLIGIGAFTMMMAIGTMLAIDEFKEFLAGRAIRAHKERKRDKLRKSKEDEAWSDYFSELPHNFLATGALVRPQAPPPAPYSPWDPEDDRLLERAHQSWQYDVTEDIRDDLR